ncbi:helix-turn-helix domain-containing protein [bacterium]|nr:helix-turn-helix domain-containing protein [bacterium]
MTQTDRLLTPDEAAERLAVSTRTLLGWLREGKINGHKVAGKLWRVSETDLRDFIESARVQPASTKKKMKKRH